MSVAQPNGQISFLFVPDPCHPLLFRNDPNPWFICLHGGTFGRLHSPKVPSVSSCPTCSSTMWPCHPSVNVDGLVTGSAWRKADATRLSRWGDGENGNGLTSWCVAGWTGPVESQVRDVPWGTAMSPHHGWGSVSPPTWGASYVRSVINSMKAFREQKDNPYHAKCILYHWIHHKKS